MLQKDMREKQLRKPEKFKHFSKLVIHAEIKEENEKIRNQVHLLIEDDFGKAMYPEEENITMADLDEIANKGNFEKTFEGTSVIEALQRVKDIVDPNREENEGNKYEHKNLTMKIKELLNWKREKIKEI